MNFKQGDILVRKGNIKDTIWVNERLVMEVCGVSKKQLQTKMRFRYKKSVQPCYHRHNILPDTGKNWRWAKIDGMFYYDLKRISNRAPNFYKDMFGDATELVSNYNNFLNSNSKNLFEIQFNHYLNTIYKEFLPAYTQPHTRTQQIALSKACAVLEFAIQYNHDNPEVKETTIYKNVCALIKQEQMSYIPSNYRKFKEKIDRFNEGEAIAEIIQLPRANNNNALVHIDDEVRSWAMQLRSMGQNYSNEWIIRKVKDMCRMTNKNTPSRRWFGVNIFEQHNTKFLTAVNRFGSNERGSKMYEGYIPMKNAIFAGDCWQVDATRMNLVAHKTAEGKKDFLFIIAVRDVHSGDVLGYNFDYKEDRWSVLNAVKMAVQEASYLPYEIVFDRFPGHNTEEAKTLFEQLEQMGVKVTFSHKATGKAGLERWFGTLQSVFMMSSEYYYGEGVKSKRENAHRSPAYLKLVRSKAHKEGFDLSATWLESQKIVEAYRETEFSYYSRKFKDINKSPKKLHSESDKPHVKWMQEHQISMLFGYKKKLQIKNSGLLITEIFKTEYIYQIVDYTIISKYKEVIISYDLNDMSSVYLFTKKNHFLIYLGEAMAYERIQPYGPNAEFNRIAIEKQRIKEIDDLRIAELEQRIGNPDEVELLMGQYTNKEVAEKNETIRLLNDANNKGTKTIKKAVGNEFSDSSNDSEIDLVSITINQY